MENSNIFRPDAPRHMNFFQQPEYMPYTQPSQALVSGGIPWATIAILFLLGVIAFLLYIIIVADANSRSVPQQPHAAVSPIATDEEGFDP